MGRHSSGDVNDGRKHHKAQHRDGSREEWRPNAGSARARKLDALPDNYFDSANDVERGGRYDKR